jgi:hypothetical protein
MGIRTWATAGAVALALATGAGVTAAASPKSVAGSTFHFSLAGGVVATYNMKHQGAGFGDRLVSRAPISAAGTGQRIGTAYGDCLIVTHELSSGTFWCRYILDLHNGQIVTEGLDPHGVSDVFFSITGGTGAYAAKPGQAEFVDSTTQTDVYIHFFG